MRENLPNLLQRATAYLQTAQPGPEALAQVQDEFQRGSAFNELEWGDCERLALLLGPGLAIEGLPMPPLQMPPVLDQSLLVGGPGAAGSGAAGSGAAGSGAAGSDTPGRPPERPGRSEANPAHRGGPGEVYERNGGQAAAGRQLAGRTPGHDPWKAT